MERGFDPCCLVHADRRFIYQCDKSFRDKSKNPSNATHLLVVSVMNHICFLLFQYMIKWLTVTLLNDYGYMSNKNKIIKKQH